MEIKPWPMTKDGTPKSSPDEINEYLSGVFTMPLEGAGHFSERELFLMGEALKAGAYYDALEAWLDEPISDGGHIVAQHLAHDADQIQPLSEWISSSEMLPPMGVKVLTYSSVYGVLPQFRSEVQSLGNHRVNYCWVGPGPYQNYAHDVTHWMPLPGHHNDE